MRAACIRFDLVHLPWDGPGDEPSYVVRIIEAARAYSARFQFFVSRCSVDVFPSMTDVLVGEGHSVDPLVVIPSRELERAEIRLTEDTFKSRQLVWDGIALTGVVDMLSLHDVLREQYRWVATNQDSTEPRSLHAPGPHDSDYLPDLRLLHTAALAALDSPTPMVVIRLHPAKLAEVDPVCALLRETVSRLQAAGRDLLTYRDWADRIS